MKTLKEEEIEAYRVKIYFNDMVRPPVYGHFVKLLDYESLLSKGMIRFQSESKCDFIPTALNSKIFTIGSFKEVRCYNISVLSPISMIQGFNNKLN